MTESFNIAIAIMTEQPLMTLGMIVLGAFLGLVFGALPGLGSITGLAIILPFTFGMEGFFGLMLYAGLYSVAPLGGSIPAILINTPGTSANIATCFEGFPLAQKGRAAYALGVSATSAMIGSLIGALVLLAFVPFARSLVMLIGASEFFWLVIIGLLSMALTAKGSLFKGLMAGMLGIFLSLIGQSPLFGSARFTFGIEYLWGGVSLVPFFIGAFALSEVISYSCRGGAIAGKIPPKMESRDWLLQAWSGVRYTFSQPREYVRGSIIGVIIGIIPGLGATVSNVVSYVIASQRGNHSKTFGTGDPDGLIATETAGNAKEGGALIPTIGFGIPGSADHAILLGALMIHGLAPGPTLIRQNLEIVYALILGIVAAQFLASVFTLVAAGYLARLTSIKIEYIAPFVVILAFMGAFVVRGNIWDVAFAILMAGVGFVSKRYGFSLLTMTIGFVLGNLAEKSFHQTLQSAYGSYNGFFANPISMGLVALIVAILSFVFVKPILRR